MRIKTFAMFAVALVLISLFAASATAAVQDRDRDEGCTGVPDDAPRMQYRGGINADSSVAGMHGNGNGICDGSVCNGSNCQGTGDCDGEPDQDRNRDGSCVA